MCVNVINEMKKRTDPISRDSKYPTFRSAILARRTDNHPLSCLRI